MDTAELDISAASAAASASGLAMFAAGAGTTGRVGPCLTVGMGEVATVAALNAWGATRDSELIQFRRSCDAGHPFAQALGQHTEENYPQ